MKTLEEIAEEFLIRQGCQRMCCNDPECNGVGDFFEDVQPKDLIEFAKWQQERMYSEEEVFELIRKAFEVGYKKYEVVEAGLEGLETDVECNWILKKYGKTNLL